MAKDRSTAIAAHLRALGATPDGCPQRVGEIATDIRCPVPVPKHLDESCYPGCEHHTSAVTSWLKSAVRDGLVIQHRLGNTGPWYYRTAS